MRVLTILRLGFIYFPFRFISTTYTYPYYVPCDVIYLIVRFPLFLCLLCVCVSGPMLLFYHTVFS